MANLINYGIGIGSSNPASLDSIPKNTTVPASVQGGENTSLEDRINRRHPTILWHKSFTETTNDPSKYVSFPPLNKQANGKYIPDYSLNINYPYDDLLRKSLNVDVEGNNNLFEKNANYYNRFKYPNPDDTLSKGFVHIFFTRPDCNILNTSGNSGLISQMSNNPNMVYAHSHCPDILRELQLKSVGDGFTDEFNYMLSNKASSFSLTDESLTSETYGQGYQRNGITYARTNNQSKANGDFDIRYVDDRDLHIYHMHKIWTDYINNVYRGVWIPKIEYMYQKIIDYACSVYYFLVAEDGETILFWSKYYGVFPVNIPSSAFSWDSGSVITAPPLQIRYQYSFKEDFNPYSLVEFNANTMRGGESINDKSVKNYTYEKTYNDNFGHTGRTWVGTPYVEFIPSQFTEDGEITKSIYKLRFKRKS